METREINQNELSDECWVVQCQGLEVCNNCKFKDTSECGGCNIRETGKNKLGYIVPLGKVVD